jgi:hypothetical protein
MQSAKEEGDRIGMLLDQGSMTLWKNDVWLGVMVAEGLSGPLCCWAVSSMGTLGSSARIGSAPVPALPTEQELTAAKAWQVAHRPSESDDE